MEEEARELWQSIPIERRVQSQPLGQGQGQPRSAASSEDRRLWAGQCWWWRKMEGQQAGTWSEMKGEESKVMEGFRGQDSEFC